MHVKFVTRFTHSTRGGTQLWPADPSFIPECFLVARPGVFLSLSELISLSFISKFIAIIVLDYSPAMLHKHGGWRRFIIVDNDVPLKSIYMQATTTICLATPNISL